MSSLMRWNPYNRVSRLNELFEDFFDDALAQRREGGFSSPKVDVVEKDNNYLVTAEMPGFTPENIDVSVEGNTLTLRGEVKKENEKDEGQYHLKERQMSSFVRRIPLPSDVNPDQCSADFDNGVLKLTLPKREEAQPKRINIGSGNKNNTKTIESKANNQDQAAGRR